ncbi:MAG: YdeI/OmpD-associated family protein [Bacteroidia bacterium]
MGKKKNNTFSAEIEIIGINPFVSVPKIILEQLFIQAGKSKGNFPVCGKVNGQHYTQTLLKYKGKWRLYINLKMLKNSTKRIGETIIVSVELDTNNRTIPIDLKFSEALLNDKVAKDVFDKLAPSLQKEINQYISRLKKEESRAKNIELAIGFLKGENKFVGRSMANQTD